MAPEADVLSTRLFDSLCVALEQREPSKVFTIVFG